jgi:hypothetical protein
VRLVQFSRFGAVQPQLGDVPCPSLDELARLVGPTQLPGVNNEVEDSPWLTSACVCVWGQHRYHLQTAVSDGWVHLRRASLAIW